MAVAWWLGIGAGAGVMGVHALLRILTHRLALRTRSQWAFLLYELGGLGGRMGIVLVFVAVTVTSLPVHKGAFVGTVAGLLVLSLLLELALVVRRLGGGAFDAK